MLGPLGSPGRPAVVRLVDSMPVTTWYRIRSAELVAEGVPPASRPASAWYWNESKGGYRALTAAARKSLLGDA